MDILIMAGQLILGLTILVALHEFGHFIAARAFGIRVEKFFVFFDAWGFKLFSFKKGDTEYGIGWLPLGGYVKIAGMIDESLDTKQLEQEPQPWEFRSKPAWQRLIVMIAGVVLNLILGVLIFIFITFKWGETYVPVEKMEYGIHALELGEELGLKDGDKLKFVNGEPITKLTDILQADVILRDGGSITVSRNAKDTTIMIPDDFANRLADAGKKGFIMPRFTFYVGKVQPKSNAEVAGLQKGDTILAVNAIKTAYFDQFQETLEDFSGKEILLTVIRKKDTVSFPVNVTEEGTIGFYPESHLENETRYYEFGESIDRGVERSWEALSQTIYGLGKMLSGDIDPQKSVQGPIAIAKNFYGSELIWSRFWYITGLLSLVIGFMNILPIPALDGGHVIFLLIEMVRGKPLPDKVLQVIQTIGVVILLALMVFIIFNDIWQNIL